MPPDSSRALSSKTTAELEAEIRRLRHGLALIAREAEQFPDEDGIDAGTMARNVLDGAGRIHG